MKVYASYDSKFYVCLVGTNYIGNISNTGYLLIKGESNRDRSSVLHCAVPDVYHWKKTVLNVSKRTVSSDNNRKIKHAGTTYDT